MQLLNGLRVLLSQGDITQLGDYIETVGLDRLLSEDLMAVTRHVRASELVIFLSTIGSQNSDQPLRYQKLLFAYQVIKRIIPANDACIVLNINPDRYLFAQLLNDLEQAQMENPKLTTIGKMRHIDASDNDWKEALELLCEANLFDAVAEYAKTWAAIKSNDMPWLSAARILSICTEIPMRRDILSRLGDALEKLLEQAPRHQKEVISELQLVTANLYLRTKQADKAVLIAEAFKAAANTLAGLELLINCKILQEDHTAALENLDTYLQIVSTQEAADPYKMRATLLMQDQEVLESSQTLSRKYSQSLAIESLIAVNVLLRQKGLQPTLISGTLLGCIREGTLLKNDKDIDLGIIGWENQFSVAQALLASGRYKFDTEKLTGEGLYLLPITDRVTGIAIDIFFFHDVRTHYRHAIQFDNGLAEYFNFSKFDLIEQEYFGELFFIPKQYEKNLSENYGNWKISDPNYVVTVESPALESKVSTNFQLAVNLELLNTIKACKPYQRAEKILSEARKSGNKILSDAVTQSVTEWIEKQKSILMAHTAPADLIANLLPKIEVNPAEANLLDEYALCAVELKDWPLAENLLHRAMKHRHSPPPRHLYANLSTVLHRLGKFEEAEKIAKKGLADQSQLIQIQGQLSTEKQYLKRWGRYQDPILTIICITFNHARYIGQTLHSFLTQATNFPFEILIHDDASTDGTQDIIRAWASRYPNIIKPILQNKNQFSQGIRPLHITLPMASGRYIAICEGDDYWIKPNKLQMQVDFLNKNSDFVASTHNFFGYEETYLRVLPEIQSRADTVITMGELMGLSRILWVHTLVFRKTFNEFPPVQKDCLGDAFLTSYLGTFGKCMSFDNFFGAVARRNQYSVWTPLPESQKNQHRISTRMSLARFHLNRGNLTAAADLLSQVKLMSDEHSTTHLPLEDSLNKIRLAAKRKEPRPEVS